MIVLVLIASLVEISRASDTDFLTLSHLLKGDIPAFGHLVVTQLEYFWLVVEPSLGVLYFLFFSSLVGEIALIVDRDEVVHLAPPLVLRLLCLCNRYTMVGVRDCLHIVAHMIIVSEEPDAWRLTRVLFVGQNSLLSRKFIEFLLLFLPGDILNPIGCLSGSLNVDRLNVVGTRNIREQGGFKDFHVWK